MGWPIKAKRVKFCPLCGFTGMESKGNGCHYCVVCDEFIEICDYSKRIESKILNAEKKQRSLNGNTGR